MDDRKKSVRIICKLFFALTLLILSAGLAKTVFAPEEMNDYENRYANKLAAVNAQSYLDGSFQDSMEAALSDQVQLSSTAKKSYNTFEAASARPFIYAIGRNSDRFVNFKEYMFLGNNILFDCTDLAAKKDFLDSKIENINGVLSAHPELDCYGFYIEKETDTNLLTGEKMGVYPYLKERIALPDGHFSLFEINSFDEFSEYFYKTDHHWNYKGSYKGYTDVAAMLGLEPLTPVDEKTFAARLSGSKAFGADKVFNEEFSAYNFDFPAMDITVNGEPAGDYGSVWSGFGGELTGDISYGTAYGGDMGLIEFDTHSGGENILVIGESYDNAILKLLASHFNVTYSVDLRYYAYYMGAEFNFHDFVAEHPVDKVLLIGNVDYYTSDDFMLVKN